MGHRAVDILRRAMARDDPGLWPLGTWLQRVDSPEDTAALASVPRFLGYPQGGHNPLCLAGWDERSTWGFDVHDDAYFAQLWRNGTTGEAPEIWIRGRGKPGGREFVITTTWLLAREIAAATGMTLPLVCAAITTGSPGCS